MKLLRVLVLLLAVAGGCGSSDVPQAFENRPEIRDCGKASYTNTRPSLAPDAPVECLKEAHSVGEEAELRVQVQGVEGDDSQWWVRALDTGEVEVFVDQSGDPLRGGPAWVRYTCPELSFDEAGLPLFGADICEQTALSSDS